MSPAAKSRIPEILKTYESDLVNEWVQEQKTNLRQKSLLSDEDLRKQCQEFLQLLQRAAQSGNMEDLERSEWQGVRDFLASVSRARGLQGFTPSETATFIFSLKKPFFTRLRKEFGTDAASLAEETWAATLLLDSLGLFTTEIYQKTRDEIISRQQEEMLELSTPVVNLWDGILALPLIGTLDSARTQVVMESLLQKIVTTGAEVAILDITGVPTVDTLVAQHLIKTVTAARLMGADCIISGIRPQIAQTIVHLGVNLTEITTKATLADAFTMALRRAGLSVVRTSLAAASADERK